VKTGRCRVWTLRYRNTAFVSLLTFLIIYCSAALTLDFDQLYRGVEALREGFQDPLSSNLDESISGSVALANHLDISLIVTTLINFYGVVLGLFNTLADYVSFLETRNILARLGRGPVRDIAWVAVDFLLTTAISIGGFVHLWDAITYFGTLLLGGIFGLFETTQKGVQLGLWALACAELMMLAQWPSVRPDQPSSDLHGTLDLCDLDLDLGLLRIHIGHP
jgi:hypothetical protein